MKKTMAFLSSIILAGASCSCSKNTENSSGSPVMVQESLCSFKSADIDMADDLSRIICTDKMGSSILIFGTDSEGKYCGYKTDASFGEKTVFTFTPQENEEVKWAALMPYGKSAVLTTLGSNTYVYIFDNEGVLSKTLELGKLISPEDRFAELLCAEDGMYINIDRHTVAYIDADGKYSCDADIGRRDICRLVSDSEGTPCVLLSDDNKLFLCRLNGGAVSEETDCGELASYVTAVCAGTGDYTVAVVAAGGLYGLKDGEWLKLSDFSDNDFSLNDIGDIEMTGEEEFSAMLIRNDGSCEMRLLTKRDISEIKQKKVIRVAKMVGGDVDPYTDQIKKYNSEHDDYKIEFVDYAEGVDDGSKRYENLKLDIIAGKAPDIVQFGYDAAPNSFGSPEGIFVDLYDMLDKDSELSRSDFVEGFLEKIETNGRLYQLMPNFMVSSVVIKDKFANGLTSWNYDQFEEIVENMPEGMDVSYNARNSTKYSMFSDLIDCSSFIDIEKAECSFDSPEFIKAVKLINDRNIGLSDEEYKALPQNALRVSYGDYARTFRNDEVILYETHLNSWKDFKIYEQVFSGEPITFIGFPNEAGKTAYGGGGYGYGIMANSENIDEAWDFLKYYLFDESSEFRLGFPALKTRLKESLDDECVLHTYKDPESGEEKNEDVYSLEFFEGGGLEYFELEPFTPEQAEEYEAFVHAALKNQKHLDSEVRTILNDELNACFAGERSAEDAAKMIQNRASIYLSETYG